ncbi:beta-phosphoglucomutase [Pantanalinema sp. GBBB05]|uniref:beta-phosphoglucomutase n=1 Tax=Pantanalinema sp. GBBB05 TaxID=2604139 RepID=UPI003D815183
MRQVDFRMHYADWIVIETTEGEFSPTQLHHKETVFTLGNGYLGTRGSFEESYPGDCPATLINGVYDDVAIAKTELVNAPNWLPLLISVAGERFRLDQGTVLAYRRYLDLYHGILHRVVRWRSPAGHTLEFHFERFASLADQHVLGVRCQVTSVDFTGAIEVHASLNGYSDTQGLLHWNPVDQGSTDQSLWLHVQSRHSKIDLAMAMRLAISGVESAVTLPMGVPGYPTLVAHFQVQAGQSVNLEKTVTVFTSREAAHPTQAVREKLLSLPDYNTLRSSHEAAWEAIWNTNDIVIEGDSTAQLAVRYNLFQLLIAAPRHDTKVSIPAKTLSGFAYRGHVFWDTEIFILPCLTYTQPELARNLLTYRYHMLPGAHRKAKAAGYEGAMYVWESADTGDEVTPKWVPHMSGEGLVRIWCGDIELHITADVAYAVWQYWQATGDRDWMQAYGAEIILDTAVFWGSRAEWNAAADRYEINDVIGPDEYHERINNNIFTNAMVKWHLETALQVVDWICQECPDRIHELKDKLDLSSARLDHWRDIIAKIWIAQDPETGLFEQFDGFFDLTDINLQDYEPRTRSMQAILGIEGGNERQVLKQPDALMLLYLLRQENFGNLDRRQVLQANWDYYVPRTDHTYGSSLGPAVHAILACELEQLAAAYEHFTRSALVDLADVRGNAAEGIHAASTGGVWQAVVFGFAGIRFTANGPVANPKLPANWTRLKFNLTWQGQTYEFDLRSTEARQPKFPHEMATLSPTAISLPHCPVFRGVIFDLDGVLTDTSEFHYQGWKRLADEEGIPFDRTTNEALRGISRRDSLLYLLNGRSVTESQLQEMMTRKNGYYLELIRTITPDHLLPGVLPLLKELRAADIKIALGSASKNAREVIDRLGIAEYMDAIADGLSVQHSKPAPDVFLHAAQMLELPPETCIIVEDAAAGIEAGLRAGMWTVGLGDPDRVNTAHLVLPNLDGVHWETLRDRLVSLISPRSSDLTLQALMLQQAHR